MYTTKGGEEPCKHELVPVRKAPAAVAKVKGNAANAGDYAAFQFPVMQRKITRALQDIEHAATCCANIGVAFSTGKDSLVLLDLVRQIIPDAPAAYYHSGDETEFTANLDLCAYYGVPVIHTEQTLADLCRNYGYWGHAPEIERDDVNFAAFMVGEPAYRFIIQYGLDCVALGLRAQESNGRAANARYRGTFYPVKNVPDHPNFYHLTPLARWTHDDVWAYIAGRELRYHPMYDAMTVAGIPRPEQRISMLMGTAFASHGRFQHLRMIAPDLWRNLANQFPSIRRLS